jgi:hypothetical protein
MTLSPLPSTPDPADEGISLPGQRFTITFTDGRAHTVRLMQRDYIAWDKTTARQKWGSAQDAPFLFQTFVAYAAAKRLELLERGTSFDAFCDAIADVSPARDDDGEDGVTRPTR